MSANNWGICPRCLAKAEADQMARIAKSRAAYGVLPADEYEELRGQAAEPISPEDFRTLREDYEIGIFDGTFSINYGSSCKTCGLSHEFKHEEQIA
jgi:hypothetical protein